MNLGAENKKQLGILGVVGVVALGAAYYMYSQLSTPDAPPPAPATMVTTPPAAAAKSTTATAHKLATPPGGTPHANTAGAEGQLDPTLHMEGMLVTESLVYTGSGRNIFSVGSAPAVVIPRTVAKVRTPGSTISPAYVPPSGLPPPPPIDLKFFGTETAAGGGRKGFLLHGEDVFFVASGDIVQRRYRVVSIEARSMVVEDIANSNRQTLPLLTN